MVILRMFVDRYVSPEMSLTLVPCSVINPCLCFLVNKYLRAGWATLLRGAELGVPTKEAGRGRLLRGVVGVDAVPPPPGGLLSIGIPLFPPPPVFRHWRLAEVGMEAEPLMVGLT